MFFFSLSLVFVFLVSTRLFSAPFTLVTGYVEKVYPMTKELMVVVSDVQLFEELPATNRWQLTNEQNKKIGIFVVSSVDSSQTKLFLHGYVVENSTAIYAGTKISLQFLSQAPPRLPDSFQSHSLLKNIIINPKDQSEMVLIPAGPFLYGSQNYGAVHYTSKINLEKNSNNPLEETVLYRDLADFYIDRYEVTNAQFGRFLIETQTSAPPYFEFHNNLDKPVDKVSYQLAAHYCRWANKRLPTELEWEKAARGGVRKFLNVSEQTEFLPADRIYPTGSRFNEHVCNTAESKIGKAVSVYQLKDASPYQVMGMCGNVPEWTSSWLLPYRGNTTVHQAFGKRYKVIRGGGFRYSRQWARSYERMAGGIPSLKEDYRAGFRCAQSID